MKAIPLGTSSGKPTLRRNVSALALVRQAEWMLFDCGEGTQIQIARAGLSPNRLSAIFITHLHGDHFNGLPGLLSTMGLDRRERGLTLIGPVGIREYLEVLSRLKVLFVSYPLELRELGAKADIAYETDQYVVQAKPLDHRIFALGYRYQEKPRPGRFDVERARALGVSEGPLFGRLQSGKQVTLDDGRVIEPDQVLGPERAGKSAAYCTDTRPCRAAVELGSDADLLIHEATYTEELAKEALEYGHSTAAQSALIARESGAARLMITHFSTRYADVAPLLVEARSIFPATIAAEDLTAVDI
jgi:ribonuclease Z